jgi:hypothetical protein
MSAPALKRYRVVVLEWLSHVAVIEAASQQEAEAKGFELWNKDDVQSFDFDYSGVDGVTADELR